MNDYPMIGSHLISAQPAACLGSTTHDYMRVDEELERRLLGKPRLVLYCRKCGNVLIHSLEIEPNDS